MVPDLEAVMKRELCLIMSYFVPSWYFTRVLRSAMSKS
jgi:hypothetical protein